MSEEREEPKEMSDRELIDNYIHWIDFLEATSGFALYPNKRDEWDSVKAEIKRRGITDETIETRRKEILAKWEKESQEIERRRNERIKEKEK
ncbi:MAG: hypothetical protein GWN17_00275 [Candidatus Korarchaeota archaeon]|nr:hypothetical protein [Candidatus Thorarchaeota archaeon]NIW50659.1 hypothetical protein [Candidatus Korarchaeota archaeon]